MPSWLPAPLMFLAGAWLAVGLALVFVGYCLDGKLPPWRDFLFTLLMALPGLAFAFAAVISEALSGIFTKGDE